MAKKTSGIKMGRSGCTSLGQKKSDFLLYGVTIHNPPHLHLFHQHGCLSVHLPSRVSNSS